MLSVNSAAPSTYGRSCSAVQVAVKTIDDATWEAQIRQSRPNFNETVVVHLRALWEILRQACRNKALMADLKVAQARLAVILGRKPITFEEDLAKFTKAHAAA